ncbi:MAG TPA: hypothetical protein VGK33_04570 [Chloroflexota bacterium]
MSSLSERFARGPRIPNVALARLAAGLGVLVAIAIAGLAYPRPADSSVSRAYAVLERSPVPVEIVGWLQPADAHAQVLDDGYVLTEQTDSFGELTLAGSRDASRLPSGTLTWQDSGTSYSLQTGGSDPVQLESRVVRLQVAQQQLGGASVDAPLLYGLYLPAAVLASGWLAVSLLRRP